MSTLTNGPYVVNLPGSLTDSLTSSLAGRDTVAIIGVGGMEQPESAFLDLEASAWYAAVEEAIADLIENASVLSGYARSGTGRAVIVLDDRGISGAEGASVQSTIGSAAIAVVKSLAREFSPRGVVTNGLAVDAVALHTSAAYREDVLSSVLLLADESLPNMTGQIVAVNRARIRTRV